MSKMPELRIDPHVRTGIVADEPGLKVVARAETREYAAQIVTACNAFRKLVEACKAWQKVESEMADKHPCPDLILRATYRKQALALTEAALAAAGIKENEHD